MGNLARFRFLGLFRYMARSLFVGLSPRVARLRLVGLFPSAATTQAIHIPEDLDIGYVHPYQLYTGL